MSLEDGVVRRQKSERKFESRFHLIKNYSEERVPEEDGTLTVNYRYSINYDRWKSLAASLYLEFLAGLIYAFPVYSGQLKVMLNLEQTELSNVSTVGNIGGNFSILAGICLDARGPTRTSTLGAFISSFGFFCLYIVTSIEPGPASVWCLAAAYFIAYQGLTWMDMSVVNAQVINFPKEKGLSVGLAKTQFGLAASAIVIMAVGFFGGGSSVSSDVWCEGDKFVLDPIVANATGASADDKGEMKTGIPLFLFFSFLCFFLGNIASHFLKFVTPTFNDGALGTGGRRKIYLTYFFVVVVMIYCLIVSILNIEWGKQKVGDTSNYNLAFAIFLTLMYSFPFVLVARTKRSQGLSDSSLFENPDTDDGIVSNTSSDEKVGATSTSLYNYGFFEALLSIDFWCLFFIFFGGTGAAYMTVNQLTQITQAVGGNGLRKNLLAVMFGVFNCVGRILMGNIQDKVGRCGVTRPVLLILTLVLMGSGQMLLANVDNGPQLDVAVCMTATAFGCTWTLIGPTSSDVMGQKAFGKIFSAISMAAILSTFTFNSIIAGPFYQAAYAEKGFDNDKNACCGGSCYEMAHTVAGSISYATVLAPLVLWFRTRTYYQKLYAKST